MAYTRNAVRAPPKGWYLPAVARARAELDSFDFIEDLKIAGGPLVHVLTAKSLHGALTDAWVMEHPSAKLTLEALSERWGTSRPDRDRVRELTSLDRLESAPPPPPYLSDEARPEWILLAEIAVQMGTLTMTDLRSMALLCEQLALETQLRQTLRREGLLVNAVGNGQKAHPAIRALESTRAQAMKLMDSFGLNPKARLGVDMRPVNAGAGVFGNNRRNALRRYTNRLPREK